MSLAKSNSAYIDDASRPVTEREIRGALLLQIGKHRKGQSLIREEFTIERGAARIDVAVIGKKLIGYEIKSDLDDFSRFSNQIHAYNRVFDEIHLVCGPQHVQAAIKVIPSWWGLSMATRDDNNVITIVECRAAKANTLQDSFSLASILWREEALAVVGEDKTLPKRASSYVVWEHIANSLSLEAIKKSVTTNLQKRPFTTG